MPDFRRELSQLIALPHCGGETRELFLSSTRTAWGEEQRDRRTGRQRDRGTGRRRDRGAQGCSPSKSSTLTSRQMVSQQLLGRGAEESPLWPWHGPALTFSWLHLATVGTGEVRPGRPACARLRAEGSMSPLGLVTSLLHPLQGTVGGLKAGHRQAVEASGLQPLCRFLGEFSIPHSPA